MVYLLATGVIVFLLDQWTKRAVQVRVDASAIFCGVFQIRHVTHAKKLFAGKYSHLLLPAAWCVSLACALMLHQGGIWFQSPASLIGLGLAFGGAAGNLFDIVQRRHVTDFIDFGWWPVFNLADVGIVGGLALAFLASV